MKNLIFALLLLTSTLVHAAEELPQFATRNLIFLFATSERITQASFTQENEDPFGAITNSGLAAIHQKVAPILITQACLRNSILPSLVKRDFEAGKTKDDKKRYPFITEANYEKIKSAFSDPTTAEGTYQEFAQAALIKFNYEDWVIRKVLQNIDGTIKPGNDLYLLIPRTYLPELKDYANSSPSKTHITDLEYKLGIKIDHMGPTNKDEFEQAMYTTTQTSSGREILASERKILEEFDKSLFFTLNQEYFKAQKTDQIPKWAIYLGGHGLSATKTDLKTLQEMSTTAQAYHDSIKKMIEDAQQLSLKNKFDFYNTASFQNFLKNFLNVIKTINNVLKKNFPFNYIIESVEKDIKELEEDLKKPKIESEKNIDSVLLAFNQQKNLVKKLHNERLGIIAGIPLLEFQKFLDFLDTKINTKFLFFSTCYAGGRNLQMLYQESLENIQGKTYSFIIASDALTDATATGYGFRVQGTLGSFIIFDANFEDFFNIINNLHTQSITYKKPFKSLIEQALLKLKNFKAELKEGEVNNIPNIKFPGLEFTQVIHLPEIVSIGQILATTHDPNKQLDLQRFFKTNTPPNVVLLYTPIIPFSIKVTKPGLQQAISFVSMTPGKLGKAYHIFEELDAQEFTPDELARAFLGIEKLTSEKVFWIKQAKFKNNEIIKDIFLVYNADNIGPTPMAYYTDNNTPYSAQWDHEQNKLINETRDDGYKKRWKKYLRDTFGPNYEQPTKTFEKIRELLKGRGKTPEEEKARLERKQIDQKLKNLAQSLQSLARSQ